MITPIISISGALKSSDYPDWMPHQNVSEAQAVSAIIHHMQGDALEYTDETLGPIHWHEVQGCWVAWGNFFLCSAGFEIEPISDEGRNRLLEAWKIHRNSRHFSIVQQLHALGDRVKAVEQSIPRARGELINETLRRAAVAPLLKIIKPLEVELNNILIANRKEVTPC